MSDERERDAAVIADFQQHIATSDYRTGEAEEIVLISTTTREIIDFALAEHRTIKRLTAERDQAREQLAKLREACEDVPWMLERAAGLYAFEIADVGIDDNSEIRSWREQSQYLRAALESKMGDGKA